MIIGHAKAVFYNNHMENIFEYNHEHVSYTDHHRPKNSSAIDGNAKSYKISFIYKSSEIFLIKKELKLLYSNILFSIKLVIQ